MSELLETPIARKIKMLGLNIVDTNEFSIIAKDNSDNLKCYILYNNILMHTFDDTDNQFILNDGFTIIKVDRKIYRVFTVEGEVCITDTDYEDIPIISISLPNVHRNIKEHLIDGSQQCILITAKVSSGQAYIINNAGKMIKLKDEYKNVHIGLYGPSDKKYIRIIDRDYAETTLAAIIATTDADLSYIKYN